MINLSNLFGQEQWLAIIHFALLILLVYAFVFFAVIVDLISGIRRSKRLGIPICSRGFRRSIAKYTQYCIPLLLVSLIDMLLFLFTAYGLFGLRGFPWLSLVGGILFIGIEIKSVWENIDRNRQKDIALALKGVASLARTKGEARELLASLAEQLAEYTDTPDEPSPTTSPDAYTRATPNYRNPQRVGREEHMHMQNEGERFEMR